MNFEVVKEYDTGYIEVHTDFPVDPNRTFSAIQHHPEGGWVVWVYNKQIKYSGCVYQASTLDEAKEYIMLQAQPSVLDHYNEEAKIVIARNKRKRIKHLIKSNVDELEDAGNILGHGGDW